MSFKLLDLKVRGTTYNVYLSGKGFLINDEYRLQYDKVWECEQPMDPSLLRQVTDAIEDEVLSQAFSF
jgi:hypothetical protein